MLEVLTSAHEHPWGEPVLFGLAVGGVGEVLPRLLSHVGDVARYRHRFHPGVRDGHHRAVLVALLATDVVEGVEAPLEVVEGPVHVQVVCDDVGVEALSGEHLGEDDLILWDRCPPIRLEAVVAYRVPVPEGPGPHPRVDGSPCRDGGDRLGVGAGEEEALLGQRVEVRGLDPAVAVSAYVVPSQAVQDHHDHVHLRSSLRKVLIGHLSEAVGQGAAAGRAEHGGPSRPSTGDL
jgi:hypothetical protein